MDIEIQEEIAKTEQQVQEELKRFNTKNLIAKTSADLASALVIKENKAIAKRTDITKNMKRQMKKASKKKVIRCVHTLTNAYLAKMSEESSNGTKQD